jgi:hypothetical protein
LGGTGVAMNARYAASLAQFGEGGTVLASVGVAVDVLARCACGAVEGSDRHCEYIFRHPAVA